MFERPVFITPNKGEFEKTLNYLKENKIKTKRDVFMGDYVVYVKAREYYRALTIGSMFIVEDGIKEIKWVSLDNVKRENVEDVANMSKLAALKGRYLREKDISLLCDPEIMEGFFESEDVENDGE